MLIQKTDPMGIDVAIQALQDKLYAGVINQWGIQGSKYKCYARCYRNRKEAGYVAENYEGNKEYKEVYHDDALYASSFFGISDNIEISEANTAAVHLIMFVNLDMVKPTAEQRADEEVRTEVCNILDAGLSHSVVRSVDLTVERVLREYRGSLRDDRLKNIDMHPVHCFRVNLELVYENINNCNSFSNI